MTAERIRFNGVVFRRYPDSANWADRQYFTPGIADRQKGVGRLHEEIWKQANGPIPEGREIHHADFDQLNNSPANLVCLTAEEHVEVHRLRNWRRSQSSEHQAHLERIRPLTVAWHKSPEGREWHRRHAAETGFGAPKPTARVCEQCGSGYESMSDHGSERFCSNKCKTAWRYASGIDNEQRICAFCGVQFTINRYAKAVCCSRACSNRMRANRPRPA